MNAITEDVKIHPFGDIELSSGVILKNAFIAYQTYGKLNKSRDNCIVFPTYFTGTHYSYETIIGPGKTLDTNEWFVVIPNLFGNGLSISPSNASPDQRGPNFPTCTVYDNVKYQHRLIVEVLNVREIALALGWSMGAIQAYQWAVCYPDLVKRLLPICGAAKCSPHNRVFIDGLMACLQADPLYALADPDRPPVGGLKAFARVYAGWAFSQTYFRGGHFRASGFEDIEALFLAWERDHLAWDAYDLNTKLATWRAADASLFQEESYAADLEAALGRIKAKTIVMPCDHDLYFTLEDNAHECALVPGATLMPIKSVFGHCAGAPGRYPAESAFMARTIAQLLAS